MWCMEPKLVWIINTIDTTNAQISIKIHEVIQKSLHEMAHILVGLTECSIKVFWLQVYVLHSYKCSIEVVDNNFVYKCNTL